MLAFKPRVCRFRAKAKTWFHKTCQSKAITRLQASRDPKSSNLPLAVTGLLAYTGALSQAWLVQAARNSCPMAETLLRGQV